MILLILSIIKSYENYSDYPLAPDKTEIKRKMLLDYQLKIADLVEELTTLLKIRNAATKNTSTSRTRIQSIAMAKTIC